MLQRVAPHCYYLPYDTHADRPCLGVVQGQRYTLRIDSGNSPAHHALMEQEMAAAQLSPSDFIALTHSHWDHTYGMVAATCPTLACRQTQVQLSRMAEWAWTPEAMARRLETGEDIEFCHRHILLEYEELSSISVRTADLVFEERMTLDLGGLHAELIHLPSSHAEDCVVVYIPEEKVVYLGDSCYEDLHHDPVCIHEKRFAALRAALADMDFDVCVPAHQLAMTKAALLEDMEETLLEAPLRVAD